MSASPRPSRHGVAVISTQTQACLKTIQESLQTHQALQAQPELIRTAAQRLCAELTPELAALFATVSHRGMGVGRLCLIHNHQIDDLILAQDWAGLLAQAQAGREVCQEIYQNPRLTAEERQIMKENLMNEYQAVLSAISNYKGGEVTLMPCLQDGEWDYTSDEENYATFFSLTEQCHQTVCLASGKIPITLDTKRSRRVLDQGPDEHTPKLYCYDLVDLLVDLLPEDPAARRNRYSQQPFDPFLSRDLLARYHKELQMVACYHDWLRGGV